MFPADSHFITVYFQKEREYFHNTVLYRYINRYTIDQIPLLIFKHQHFGYFSKSLTIHQHQIMSVQISRSPQSREFDHHRRIKPGLSCNIEIHDSFKGAQHRKQSIKSRYYFYQTINPDFMHFQCKARISPQGIGCFINQRSLHISRRRTHIQIGNLNTLILHNHFSVYVLHQ